MTLKMTSSRLLFAAAFLLVATSTSMAQGYVYFGNGYGTYQVVPGPGVYDYAPLYGYGYGYDYGYNNDYRPRGGPGPRVGNGTGMGIGAVR